MFLKGTPAPAKRGLRSSIALLGQFLSSYSGPDRQIVICAFIFIVLGLLAGIFSKFIFETIARKVLFRPDGYGTSPQHFRIQGDALVHTTRSSSSSFSWPDIEEVDKTRDYIFLFLDRGLAIYISKRGFVDDATYGAFFEQLVAKVSKSKA